ncbi:Odorant receptor 30 [Ephemera danica]|nr:Odorant receptor 30 [Ephemera danica]
MLSMNGVVPRGLRAMILCNQISGFWLQSPTSRSKRLLVSIFEWFIVILLIYNTIYNIVRLFSIKNFVLLVLTTSAILGITHTTFSSIMLIIKKKQIISIIKEAQYIVKIPNFYYQQLALLHRVSMRTVYYLIFPFLGFVFAHSNSLYFASYIVINPTINATSPEEQFIKDAVANSDDDINIMQILVLINLFSQSFSALKLVCMDTLLFTLLYFVSEELKILRATLYEAMLIGPVPSFKRVDLTTWLHCQRRLSRLMARINKTWAPMIVVTVLCNTLAICFLSYTIVRVSEFKILVWIVIGYTLLTFLDVFLYCEAGHRLKTQGEAITDAVCQGPWLHMKSSFVPGMNLVANNCSRSFVARGGPFFTLSLEFFASLVGAVLTYLIVLLQIK